MNGVVIGTQKGAFAAFCFEATDAMKRDGNRLEIEVSNEFDPSLPPLSADFTLCGGLYRSVWLIETDPVCIDPTIDGGPGVRVFPSMDGTVRVEADVSGADDAIVDWEPKKVEKPLLWSPETPNVYTVKVTVRKGGWSDSVEQPFGFRTVEFREDGFYLNGVRRKVRGVNRHQDLEGLGWEQTPLQEERDMRLIKDMGADGVRLAHYPQSENIYNLCDRLGLMIWNEIPVVDRIGRDVAAFRFNMEMMLREMVAQKRNHPSVCWWGIWNELDNGYERWRPEDQPRPGAWEAETAKMVELAKHLDPSRPVVAATFKSDWRELNLIPQQVAINVYPRWYTSESMRECIDRFLGNYRGNIIGISEYGVGGSVFQHENPPVFKGTVSPHHTEEYMTDVHIEDWRQIAEDERVWGSFVWAMFDFAADARREGDKHGVNDKGLVTRDRVTAKDAYFFYRANWNPEPLLHLAGKRLFETPNAVVQVVAFSNVGDVTLFVNGRKIAAKTPDAVSTVRFEGVALADGDNEIRVESGNLSDVAHWRCIP